MSKSSSEIPLYIAENDFRRPDDSSDDIRKNFRVREDVSRIKHSSIFRALNGKKQLFPQVQGGTVRNRLTHSLEVSDVAVRIARKINDDDKQRYFKGKNKISVDLMYAASLIHDIGHPPFGHTGERALNEALVRATTTLDKKSKIDDFYTRGSESFREFNEAQNPNNATADIGYEGNAQTIRAITQLENRLSPGRRVESIEEARSTTRGGLNLCFRTLLSALKYDREITTDAILEKQKEGKVAKGYYPSERPFVDMAKQHCVSKLRYYKK